MCWACCKGVIFACTQSGLSNLQEEEAPPLPPEEPPEPPLPPEVDQPVDEDVYPPMPDSPPPLPPDDAQWHPLESTVQIAVPQAVRGQFF